MTQPGNTAAGQLALAEAARQVQIQNRAKMLTEVARAWPLLDPKRLTATWPGWLQVMVTILTRYHTQSAGAAGAYYRAARARAVADTGGVGVKLAAPPSREWLEKALGWAGPGQISRTDLPPAKARQSALTQTLGTSSRIMLDGSRTTIVDTVKADPAAVGYYRKTDGDPCYFCALLASRGVVYKDDSFREQQVHNHCGCVLAPAFSRDAPLPTANREALDVYLSRGKGPALQAFRKAWESRAPQAA